ncbi:MAG TPA: SIMPL domain-containing protein [Gemmatimonadota bacterium]|nr:SIMPL domain-containing protein [Gemmatimonadota bacterium]
MSRHAFVAPLTALALCLPVASLAAQEIEVGPDRAVVTASGNGEVMLRPDRASVSVTVRTIAPEPDQAASRNLATAEDVTEALEALDLEPDSLRLTGVRIGPNREYRPDGPRDAGYFAERSLRVTTNDLADVGRIIQAAVGAGATQIDHVAYSSSEEEAARQRALTLAVEKARGDAQTVAAAAGGRLGNVILLSTEGVSVPRPMLRMEAMEMSRAAADQAMPEPEDLTVTAYVQGHWAFEKEEDR